jgi:hypothetical protein
MASIKSVFKKYDAIPPILEPNGAPLEFPKNCACLIQKVNEVDPLTCPQCENQMKIIRVIENEKVIKKILKHLGLWDIKSGPLPKATPFDSEAHDRPA